MISIYTKSHLSYTKKSRKPAYGFRNRTNGDKCPLLYLEADELMGLRDARIGSSFFYQEESGSSFNEGILIGRANLPDENDYNLFATNGIFLMKVDGDIVYVLLPVEGS